MVNTIIDFSPGAEVVTVILKEEDERFATQLLTKGWKYEPREDGVRALKHKWYKGISDFLLDLFPKACFTYAFARQSKYRTTK